ncbi:MAG: class I SAM-dependent methyltransferase [Chloroflexota bacterium]|nr:class I SAM-dependent methyltransferase [Chloroflexota bacterium]
MGCEQAMTSYYSQWWENPRDIRNAVFEKLNRYVSSRIPPGDGKRALDLGSGRGRIVSYLLDKGYQVTAVELNEDFCAEMRERFPSVNVISGDVRHIRFDGEYDVVTCIELVQNLQPEELADLLSRLAPVARVLLVNISNRDSMHHRWVELRGWRNSFVFSYAPGELDRALRQAGFHTLHQRGVGLVTPISLFSGFRGRLLPAQVANAVNRLDPIAARICHLYYVEAAGNSYQ